MEGGSQRTRGSSGGSLPLRRNLVQEEPLMPTLRASAFPGGSLVNNQSANARDAGEESSIPGREDSWRRKWQATPVFLSRKAHGQRRLVGRSPWGQQRVEHDWATEHARGLRSTRRREGDGDTYFSGTD